MAWPPISLRLWKRENISKEMAKEETPKVFWSDRLENLAERLAQLYDDYLGSRYRMLVNWERGLLPEGAGRWQALLYRKLLTECPESYTRDFDAALSDTVDLNAAFKHGFPQYESIHVFDVTTAPWPYLMILRQVARVRPVLFWNFNPSREYWLEDRTKRTIVIARHSSRGYAVATIGFECEDAWRGYGGGADRMGGF